MFVWEYDHPPGTRIYMQTQALHEITQMLNSFRALLVCTGLFVCYGKAHQCRKAVKLSAEFQVGVPGSVFFSIVHIYCEIVPTMVPAVRVTSHVIYSRLRGEYLGP